MPMKKPAALMVALILMASMAAPALGEGAEKSAKGVVRCAGPEDIFAPVGGQLLPFGWDEGDPVKPGDVLAAIRPRQVLAANDGVIRSLRAEVGDQAADVQKQFGALCAIDRVGVMWVDADTSSAHNKPENRAIELGEALRVYNGKDSNPLEAKAP